MPSVETIVAGLKKVQAIRLKTSHFSLIKGALIPIILIIAFSVRLLPIRWGYFLSEFDPYYQYRQVKYITEHGLYGENGWIEWRDFMSWYPYGNRVARTTYLGLPLTAAALYFALDGLGIQLVPSPSLDPLLSDPVYNLCVIFPVIMATVTCLVIYFVGKDLGGESVGMLAALFLALDSSYINRTSLGWFDDETVGIFGILLFVLFFLRSIDENKPLKTGLQYAVAAGLSLGYLCASWGASRYPVVMTAMFALVLIVAHRYSSRLLLSYAIIFLLTLLVAVNVPYLGFGFIYEVFFLPVYAVLFALLIAEINQRAKTSRQKLTYILIILSLATVLAVFLWSRGMIKGLETKFLSVLNPFVRFESPIVESVAEHRPSAWGTFYYNFGVGVFFMPVGLFFASIMATNSSLFMIIFGLTSIFFASSMIRLNIIMSPVLSLLWALGVVRLLRPFILSLMETPQAPRQKTRFGRILGRETAAGIVAMMFILLTLTYVVGADFVAGPLAQGPRVYTQAFAPSTIASAGMSAKPSSISRDWIDTLIWLRENTPPSPPYGNTVVASWWDYGYWITAMANRTTLADNGTWNWTQIQQIGLMFMSNETEAIKILRKYDVTYVIVFTTFTVQQTSQGYSYPAVAMAGGDEGKWEWMARIPGLDPTPFGNYTLGVDWIDVNKNGQVDSSDTSVANKLGENTTLYKLMTYGREVTVYGYSSVKLQYFEEAYFSQKYGSPQAAPGTSIVPLVCVYKVQYPET